MKKQAYMIITAIMLVTVAGLSTAKAQTIRNAQLRANIPFTFSFGEKTLPAGEYILERMNPNSPTKILQLRSKDGHDSVLVLTNSVIGKIQSNARFVFHHYSDGYFFAQAWLPSDSIGMQALKSRTEKSRELAREKRSTETVVATVRR